MLQLSLSQQQQKHLDSYKAEVCAMEMMFEYLKQKNKKAQLSLTNLRDACEKFARFA